MKKVTQKEILGEGFWDNFKNVGRMAGGAIGGAVAGGAKLIDKALPELTKPIKDTVGAIKDIKGSVASGWNVFQSKREMIRKQLEDMGYVMTNDAPRPKNKNLIVFANKIDGIDPNTHEFTINPKKVPFVLDPSGNLTSSSYTTKRKAKRKP